MPAPPLSHALLEQIAPDWPEFVVARALSQTAHLTTAASIAAIATRAALAQHASEEAPAGPVTARSEADARPTEEAGALEHQWYYYHAQAIVADGAAELWQFSSVQTRVMDRGSLAASSRRAWPPTRTRPGYGIIPPGRRTRRPYARPAQSSPKGRPRGSPTLPTTRLLPTGPGGSGAPLLDRCAGRGCTPSIRNGSGDKDLSYTMIEGFTSRNVACLIEISVVRTLTRLGLGCHRKTAPLVQPASTFPMSLETLEP